MPKRQNIKKGAAALFQNDKAIAAFEDGEKNGGVCGAVIRMLGRSGFQVHCGEQGLVVQATPRGLFTKGTMRFSVGDIVILQGTERVMLDARPRFWEIVGRVEPAEVARLAARSKISPEVMAAGAAALQQMKGEQSSEEKAKDLQSGDFFLPEENPQGEEGTANPRASIKEQRAAREAAASIQARVATLKGNRGKRLDGSVSAGELTDPLAGLNEEFARWRASGGAKKRVAMSIGGSTAPVQTEEDLMVEAEDERLRAQEVASEAALVSSLNAAAHAAEIKAFLESRQVPENWDEVNLDDL